MLRYFFWTILLCCAATIAAEPGKLPAPANRQVDFVDDVLPILQKHCFNCHGAEKAESGLRLDVKKHALTGGDSGAVIVVGKSAESRLIHLVAGLDNEIMPPADKGERLSAKDVGTLRAWIDQGAAWPDQSLAQLQAARHWSLQPIRSPVPPLVAHAKEQRQPIDAFVIARLAKENLEPSPTADRATLIRRLSLDLLGLPPTPTEVDAFIADPRPDALEQLVDRLLSSPHYGERWGRHWLDQARYADSDGYEKDKPRPFAYRYRDWVIAALNADMPFDQFTVEQLAGDLLPNATVEQRIATGLHRNTLHNTEGGIDPEEDRVKKTVDRTNTLGAVWLGLTLGCAQCHSHKYDPITQREYFSLYALFNSIQEHDLEAPTPEEAAKLAADKEVHSAKTTELKAALTAYETNLQPAALEAWEQAAKDAGKPPEGTPPKIIKTLAKAKEDRKPAEQAELEKHHRLLDEEWTKLNKTLTDHQAKSPKLPPQRMAQTVTELAQPRETRLHQRGDFLSPGDVVHRGTPEILPAVNSAEKLTRLDLARWLVGNENPLTARVTVNRHWQQLFGRGLVATSDDFGRQGDKPSHPELLDWLANDFRAQGWSLKQLHRRIVTSATYQQSSAARRELRMRDPDNELLARQTRRRVEAEILRDVSLATSGLLVGKLGGPSVHPPQPSDYASLTYAGSAKWVDSKGADRYRRGLYTFFQRTSPYPLLATFDTPDSTECTVKRQTSNTPIQSLTLWNDTVFFESAQHLARRVVREVPAGMSAEQTVRARATHALRLCIGRVPSQAEVDDVISLYQDQLQLAGANSAASVAVAGNQPAEGATLSELAAWVNVSRTLMNLDEFVTRE
ncbi:PSD1 and planctomycete cytochrome C domain-containing protein [Anatilimnocola floriformis]|uniref:PSD1 and planctomycete cytochrome C domain-containing protein n=1 Tax=Anatilimnocola floriformis TaxID=2948575 RepID=UPI0020C4CFEF|nr:PSD1 and planctomycete cytochrome C domain-containing protein [Anatilimnocola floriformis]